MGNGICTEKMDIKNFRKGRQGKVCGNAAWKELEGIVFLLGLGQWEEGLPKYICTISLETFVNQIQGREENLYD